MSGFSLITCRQCSLGEAAWEPCKDDPGAILRVDQLDSFDLVSLLSNASDYRVLILYVYLYASTMLNALPTVYRLRLRLLIDKLDPPLFTSTSLASVLSRR